MLRATERVKLWTIQRLVIDIYYSDRAGRHVSHFLRNIEYLVLSGVCLLCQYTLDIIWQLFELLSKAGGPNYGCQD